MLWESLTGTGKLVGADGKTDRAVMWFDWPSRSLDLNANESERESISQRTIGASNYAKLVENIS